MSAIKTDKKSKARQKTVTTATKKHLIKVKQKAKLKCKTIYFLA